MLENFYGIIEEKQMPQGFQVRVKTESAACHISGALSRKSHYPRGVYPANVSGIDRTEHRPDFTNGEREEY